MREANRHTAEILDLMCRRLRRVTTWTSTRSPVASSRVGACAAPSWATTVFRPRCASRSTRNRPRHPQPGSDSREGDIVSLDFGVVCGGYVGDHRAHRADCRISAEAATLLQVTRVSRTSHRRVSAENRLSEIGSRFRATRRRTASRWCASSWSRHRTQCTKTRSAELLLTARDRA